MKKKYRTLLIIILMLYPIYKGIREIFWVRHSSYTIDNIISIKLRVDTDILSFQDYNNDKTITITNTKTKSKVEASYVSLEPDLYFYLDTINSPYSLSVVDKFAGQNNYDYSSLKLINKEDCFVNFGGCGGFNDSNFAALGKPYLIYDYDGFHR